MCGHACETNALEETVVRLQSDERLHGRKLKWADVELLDPSEGEVVDLSHHLHYRIDRKGGCKRHH